MFNEWLLKPVGSFVFIFGEEAGLRERSENLVFHFGGHSLLPYMFYKLGTEM